MMEQPGILIVDDDPEVALAARLLLRKHTPRIETIRDPNLLDSRLAATKWGLVLLDLNFTPGRTDGAEGFAALARLRSLPSPPPVIALTAFANISIAVEALQRGAVDFVAKPWDEAKLAAKVASALARVRPETLPRQEELLGESPPMRVLRGLIATVAPTDANILILGENGVGKELIARAIHEHSHRAHATFLSVDMGALPESTLESELFGHRRGAFTDARSDRVGRFQACRGGTLFLDEIGNVSLATQAKLLTAVERRQVTPVGADEPETIDVRIVSATNVEEFRLRDPRMFRADLLYRLNTIVIRVPPLRERREDIPVLLRHYLSYYAARYQREFLAIAPESEALLCTHDWPGNVRALRHACERAVILARGQQYTLTDFCIDDIQGTAICGKAPAKQGASAECPSLNLNSREKGTIVAALVQSRNNISGAARLLGLSRAALYRRLAKYEL